MGAICRAEPLRQGGGGAGDQWQNGLTPEGAVGFLVVGEGVVAGDTSKF